MVTHPAFLRNSQVVLSSCLTANCSPDWLVAFTAMTFLAKSSTWYSAFHTGNCTSSPPLSGSKGMLTCTRGCAASSTVTVESSFDTLGDSTPRREKSKTEMRIPGAALMQPWTIAREVFRKCRQSRHWRELQLRRPRVALARSTPQSRRHPCTREHDVPGA